MTVMKHHKRTCSVGSRRLSRRTLLRGLAAGAAVSVSLPVLDAMLDTQGKALADGTALPKRFGVFFWGNGVRLAQFVPSTEGAGFALSPALQPFAELRDYVSVVSGYDIKTGNERGHHAGCVGILSGAPMLSQDPKAASFASTFSAPSIDQLIATGLAANTRFRSLELGISKSVSTVEGTTLRYLSHNGPNNPNPPEYSPAALYSRLFGDAFTAPTEKPKLDPKLALRRSVLSAVREDATALRARLGKRDQQRIDQHFESIRALENQIAASQKELPPPAACARPSQPMDGTLSDERLGATNAAMSKLLAMSLACDQSRVFSVLFSGSVGSTTYPEIKLGNHHSLTHDEGGAQPSVQQITVYIMQRFAELLTTLRDVREGDGNLLDRCVILASSDCAEGQPHTINDYPILVAGGGGGSLARGVHIRGQRGNASDVLLSLVKAMDLPAKELGVMGGLTSQTVPGLLT